jgi:hypothetical protein
MGDDGRPNPQGGRATTRAPWNPRFPHCDRVISCRLRRRFRNGQQPVRRRGAKRGRHGTLDYSSSPPGGWARRHSLRHARKFQTLMTAAARRSSGRSSQLLRAAGPVVTHPPPRHPHEMVAAATEALTGEAVQHPPLSPDTLTGVSRSPQGPSQNCKSLGSHRLGGTAMPRSSFDRSEQHRFGIEPRKIQCCLVRMNCSIFLTVGIHEQLWGPARRLLRLPLASAYCDSLDFRRFIRSSWGRDEWAAEIARRCCAACGRDCAGLAGWRRVRR